VLNKFLLISLGGSGEKLARYLKQDLEQRLRRREWNGGLPRAFRWLCVDVAQKSTVLTGDVPADLGDANGLRIGLGEADLEYRHYFDRVIGDPDALPALVGTLPGREAALPAPADGAGQRPQVGNVVGIASLDRLKRAIEAQMVELRGDGVDKELESLANTLHPDGQRDEPRTTILIASSLGGGAGAGLLQLVVELVLNSPATADHRGDLATVLFAPDIFYDLTPQQQEGVQANSLFVTAALLNGYYGSGERPAELAALLEAAGVGLDGRRRAAATNFVICRDNGEFDFKHQNTAIKSAAKALGRLLLDEEVTNRWEAHLRTNGDGAPVTSDFRIAKSDQISRAASSFGYASVSLGGAQLAEYASERLAKAQLDCLLRGHRGSHLAEESDDATTERLASEQLPSFLARAELRDEDLLGLLYDRAALHEDVKRRAEKVAEAIRDGSQEAAPARWLKRIDKAFGALEDEFDREWEAGRERKAAELSERVQTAVVEATIESLGRHGVPVTEALLAAAAARVKEGIGELRRERNEEINPKVDKLAGRARALLGEIKVTALPNSDEALAKAAESRGIAVFHRLDAAYHELAADTLAGFPAGVLGPLRQCVASAGERLSVGERQRHRELVNGWPSKGVPPRVMPAPSQLLLEPVESFPGLFDELLEATTGGLVGDAERNAVMELLTGGWLPGRDRDAPGRGSGLIARRAAWRHGSATPAQFELRLEIPELKARAEEWVRQRPGALAERLELSLADWLAVDPGRKESFAATFELAKRRARPMAKVNKALHQRVHGRVPEPWGLHVSTIPIDPEDGIYQRLARSLDGLVGAGEVQQLFDATSSASEVEFSSFLAQSVEPVVIEGLFRPIGEDWKKKRADSSMREQFSAFRRTRPLSLFAPLSPEQRRHFAIGWLVADLLGQLSPFGGSWDRGPLEVWSPDGWLRLPRHLLGGDVEDPEEVFARVLESLPLALVSFASEQYEELDAYMRILDLGKMRELRKWVETGAGEDELPGVIEAPPSPLARDLASDTPEARRQRILDRVGRMRGDAEAYRDAHPIDRRNVAELEPRWEATELILEALKAVSDELVGLPLHHPDSDPPDPAPLAQ
jgi:hypothetical protein